MPLESIDHIHGGDSLPLGVFSVGDSIPDHILQENLENSTSLLIDEARDTLDSSTTSQPPDGGLGDALDVVSQHLPVPLGASLSQSLSSFATSSHVAWLSVNDAVSRDCILYIRWPGQSEARSSLIGQIARRDIQISFAPIEFRSKSMGKASSYVCRVQFTVPIHD